MAHMTDADYKAAIDPKWAGTSWSADATEDGRMKLGDWVLVRAKVAAILDGGTIAVQTHSSKGPDTGWHYVGADRVLTIPEARKSFGVKAIIE